MRSDVSNRPLVDGNKRLGWLATAVFLELNDAGLAAAANDDVYDLVMSVAISSPSTEGVAAALRRMHKQATAS